MNFHEPSFMWVDENFDRQEGSTSTLSTTPKSIYNDSWHAMSSSGVGSAIKQPNTIGHVGILRLTTATATNNDAILFLSRDYNQVGPNEAMLEHRRILYADFWVRVPTITNVEVAAGLFQDVSAGAFGTDGVFFDYTSSSSANWRCFSRAAGVPTASDSGVPVVAGAWYHLQIRPNNAGNRHKFTVNYTDGVTINTTDIMAPTTGLCLGTRVITLSAASRTMEVDRILLGVDPSMLIG